MTSTVLRVQCARPFCALEVPVGYLSRRGYCADCEYQVAERLKRSLHDAKVSLKRIKHIVAEHDE